MFEPLLDALRDQVSGERALAAVESVARFHRVQASPGYDAAAAWLAGELEASGLRVELEHAPGDGRSRRLGALMPEGWECSHARATLMDAGTREALCDYDRLKLSLILRSDPARGHFPLVEIEDGTEDEHYRGRDVRGRVVLTRGAVQRVHQLAVIERGAAGILFDGRRLLPPVRGPLDDPDAVSYTSFWWQAEEPRGWGFVVSPGTGAGLRERLRRGALLELEVEIASRRFATPIPLLSGTLPGASEREVLVLSHLCHPEPSANDNGSGVAASLEAARALAALFARPGGRPRTLGIRFLWVPELTGTYAYFAGPHGPDGGLDAARAQRTVAALNLDMVGEDQAKCGSTLLIEHPPCFAGSFAGELLRRIRDRAQDWVTSYSGPGHFSLTRMSEVPFSGGSDHAVLVDPLIGVPCPMLIQWPDRYYHSSHDTPDKCDPASLALAARCAATYAGFLATAGRTEHAWLRQAVQRGSERRVLAALDDPEPERAMAAEALRDRCTVQSLRRLEAAVMTPATAEPGAGRPRKAIPRAPDRAAVPTRTPAPLEMQRHLIEGYAALSRAEREGFRRFEAEMPGGTLALDLAWFACDGQRTVEEIAQLVGLEIGGPQPCAPQRIAEFFAWTARLGRSGWRDGGEGR